MFLLFKFTYRFKFTPYRYDEAATMSGQFAGTAQLIKDKCFNALYVHCLSHCVNLAAVDASKDSVLIKDAADSTHKLVCFIIVSGRRRDLL